MTFSPPFRRLGLATATALLVGSGLALFGSPAGATGTCEGTEAFRNGVTQCLEGKLYSPNFFATYSGGEDTELSLPQDRRACSNYRDEGARNCCLRGFESALGKAYDRILDLPSKPDDPDQRGCRDSYRLGTARGDRYCSEKKEAGGDICIMPDFPQNPISHLGCYHLGLVKTLSGCGAGDNDPARLARLIPSLREEAAPIKGAFPPLTDLPGGSGETSPAQRAD